MTASLTAAALLADNPNLALDELTAHTAGMNTRDEDLFWAKVREINPTLCPDW
ncbi:hypothetical protein [Nonomuraea sp. WAC 01424]|uniref:hypothetical protein n=1 Tax=Nonomuraea sp. WAC 01424 TaxID=2203200 RepID=UPI00163C02BC|nr:hypothetical protein [Nonomuraea sp. WAC 01424]